MKPARALLMAWVPAILLVALVPLAARVTGHPVSFFTRDVFSVSGVPVYAALLSNFGMLMWCTTAALCLFTSIELAHEAGDRRFFVGFGILSLMFLTDDFYMLHEWIVPKVTGFPEFTAFGLYALVLTGIVATTRRQVMTREPLLLLIAVTLFGGSVAMDVVEIEPASAGHYLVEEGFKFFGIVTWAVYFVRACRQEAIAARGRNG